MGLEFRRVLFRSGQRAGYSVAVAKIIRQAPVSAMFFQKCAAWFAACIGSAIPQNLWTVNAAGTRNAAMSSAPHRTCTPSRMLTPPARSMRPEIAVSTVGAGTPDAAAYCEYELSLVR